jgi:hypothetical protein
MAEGRASAFIQFMSSLVRPRIQSRLETLHLFMLFEDSWTNARSPCAMFLDLSYKLHSYITSLLCVFRDAKHIIC